MEASLKRYTEAVVYQNLFDERMQTKINVPGQVLCMFDKRRGKQLVVIELVPQAVMTSFMFQGVNDWVDNPEVPRGMTSYEPVIVGIAEQLAGLHSQSWCDREKLQKHKDTLRQGDWMLGEGQEQFEYRAGIVKKMAKFGDWCVFGFSKRYPLTWRAVSESVSKYSWADYQRKETNPILTTFCFVHGDAHPKNFLWSLQNKKIYMIDFEMMGFGHPTADLCYILAWLGKDLRRSYGELFLQSYHRAMLASGKV